MQQCTFRWKNTFVKTMVHQRAIGKAMYSGDPQTANNYMSNVNDIIDNIESNIRVYPERQDSKGRMVRVAAFAQDPVRGDVLLYKIENTEAVGLGVFTSVPDPFPV